MVCLNGLCFQIIVLLAVLDIYVTKTLNDERALSRRKRYVVFPEGSSFSAALCLTVAALAPSGIFTEGLNWGIAYDLPNDTRSDILPNFKGPRPVLMRRRRSDLYQKFETLLESAGINGRECLFRTLCEAGQRYSSNNNLLDEIMRIIFHFPMDDFSVAEPTHHKLYKSARQFGLDNNSCLQFYTQCPISMLDMIFQ